MQTEQDQIRAYRAQVLNADTLEQLQAIAVQMIGHCEGFDDDDARADLLDYLSEWDFDLQRRQYVPDPFFSADDHIGRHAYFHSLADAEAYAKCMGGYVLMTTHNRIWRVTR